MSAVLRREWWENGRLHRIWLDPDTGKVTHERLIPPKHIEAHAKMLEGLKDSSRERARQSNGIYQVASFTANERDELHRLGVKLGDVDGLKWALRQDRWRHAKVGS